MKTKPIPTLGEAEIERFWAKVDRRGPDECWEWNAKARHVYGYGLFKISKRVGNMAASRISCFLAHGHPPDDCQFALHSCDNPPCCNPNHLRWGSQKHNAQDAIERNRASLPPRNSHYRRFDTQPKGAALHNQSLTETQVRAIWRMHLAGGFTVKAIALSVGSKIHVVADVTRGRSWRHLDGAPSVEALKCGGVRRGHNQFSNASLTSGSAE